MDFGAIKDRLFEAAATAVLLGGGAQVMSLTAEQARQSARIENVERIDDHIEGIRKDVSETREAVVRLETKLEK